MNPDSVNFQNVQKHLDSELGNNRISNVSLAGHGHFGGAITTEDLKKSNSATHSFFAYLGSKMADNNGGIELRACEMAKDKDFMKTMAATSNSKVKGWDDWYAIKPHGKEWTAYPNGDFEQTGDTHRQFKGSWTEWFYNRRNGMS